MRSGRHDLRLVVLYHRRGLACDKGCSGPTSGYNIDLIRLQSPGHAHTRVSDASTAPIATTQLPTSTGGSDTRRPAVTGNNLFSCSLWCSLNTVSALLETVSSLALFGLSALLLTALVSL